MHKAVFLLSAMLIAGTAQAAVPIYGNIGTPNNAVPFSYGSFTASSTGVIEAYFLGRNATYESVLSLKVNGVLSPQSPVFNNQATVLGTKVVLGSVVAGDSLEFIISLLGPPPVAGNSFSSIASNNAGGNVHIYRDSYGGGDFGIPLGTYSYIGFEDIAGPFDGIFRNDWDYDDHRFAFINVQAVIPEPASWAMMIAGFGLIGASLRRSRRPQAV